MKRLLRDDVIKDLSVFLRPISFSEDKMLIKEGSNKKVTNKETNKPKVIIHPKSIMGLIPLKTKDKNAQIVVNTVYRIGSIIFLLASNTASLILR